MLFIGDRKIEMTPDGKLLVDGSLNVLGDLEVGGDLKVGKTLSAKEVNTEKINVSTPGVDSNGKSKASVGEGTITTGQTEVTIETTAVTADSRIFITPTSLTDKVLVATEKVAGESFKVKILSPAGSDIIFDWWVVN